MKKERERKVESGRRKGLGKKSPERKRTAKMRVTGNTEILDFDLPDDETEKTERKKEKRACGKKESLHLDKAKKTEKKESKRAAKTYVRKNPKKPAAVRDETLEILELDEILAAEEKKQGGKPEKKQNRKPQKKQRQKAAGADFNIMDAVIALTGVLVLFIGGIAFGVYRNAAELDKQVAAMAEVGEKMETLGIAGESIFVAVADARIAAQEIADEAPPPTEPEERDGGYEEKELVTRVNVVLKLSSVQKDLKIKFTNKETGKLIGNQAFTVRIDGPESMTKTDDDKDGIIYINSIRAGEYTVTITAPEEIDGATAAGTKGLVTVKDTIEYKKIDVADEVKKESEINVAKEDTAVAPPVESVVTDTVEWVESAKTPADGDSGGIIWEEVKKSDIPDPSITAAAALDMIRIANGENGAYRKDTVKLAQNAAPFADNPVKTVKKGAYFTQDGAEVQEHETMSAAETGITESEPDGREDGETGEDGGQDGETGEDGGQDGETGEGGGQDGETGDGGNGGGGETKPAEPPEEKPEFTVTGVSILGDRECSAGDSITLTADAETTGEGSLSDSDYSWSGQGVSGSGQTVNFSANAAGSYEVKVTVKGVSAAVTVNVKEKPVEATVSGVSVSTNAARVETGQSATVTASVSMSDGSAYGGSIEWASNGGQLSGSGTSVTLTGSAAQKITVTAKAGGKENSVEVEFYDPDVKVSGITVLENVTVAVGGTVALSPDVRPSDARDKSVEWKVTEGTDIVSVDGDGTVRGLKAGSAKVQAAAKDGSNIYSNVCTVTVSADIDITLEPAALSCKVGEKKSVKAIVNISENKAVTWKSGDESVLKIVESRDDSCTIEALKAGKATVVAVSKANQDKTASIEVTVELKDGTVLLKDKAGNQLYYKDGGEYREATAADYYKYDVFYRQKDTARYNYTGWQNIDGKRFYFDKNGNPVTGEQIIQGMQYSFNGDGSLQVNGSMGIDVSKHNGNIDWNAVKNAGVDYVIIRCGYRGSATGVLVEDEKFGSNIQGAQAAGLKVGIYFFSQAVNEREALEEASLAIDLIRKYKIAYPVYMDVEAANGRADGLDAGTRTQIIKTFCETIRGSGYTAGVYANKTWLSEKMNVGALGNYKIWLAQYAAAPTYSGRYEMWQYSSKGRISGISTDVDLNISYMSY